ncbi:hypothetical protein M885DRAFT_530116 [Pelagophyceae sp. CCMP2097]|nr:hypothetical protein M885DRAFT_530116 [Pelagophyceae sp. CCMP2097]|mmetsp:Transcript_31927/g.109802  ORF Transcript_31927/g.109802 Transcript_31927/m.109802 type:complete len:483 (-) Transcript_31927:166-1614(-)
MALWWRVVLLTQVAHAAAAASHAGAPDPISALRRDLERHGAAFLPFRVDDAGGERRVVAAVAISAGAVVLRLPRSCLVFADAGAAAACVDDLDNADALAVWILSNPESAYVSTLPTAADLSHLPVYWADSEALRGTDVYEDLLSRQNHDAQLFAGSLALRQLCAGDAANWKWAKACVRSRAFTVPKGAGGDEDEDEDDDDDDDLESVAFPRLAAASSSDVPCLVPLVDMLNHVGQGVSSPNCEWGVERETGDFVVRCISDCKEGAELVHSYGDLSAAHSLLNYGFVASHLEFRNHDAALLTIDLPEGASQLLRKFWRREGFQHGRAICVGVPGDRGAAEQLLSLCRCAAATDGEAEALLAQDGPAESAAPKPLSWRNERAALALLENAAEARLAAHPRSVDEDERLVADLEASAGARDALHAARVSLAEKRVLVHWRAVSRAAKQLLQATDVEGAFNTGLYYAALLDDLSLSERYLDDDAPP